MRGIADIIHMMKNAVNLGGEENYNLDDTIDYLVDDITVIERLSERQEKLLRTKTIKEVARGLNLTTGRDTIRTARNQLKNVHISWVNLVSASQVHYSAFMTQPFGEDNDTRTVRRPPMHKRNLSDMNSRGRQGVYTRNLDAGLWPESRLLCSNESCCNQDGSRTTIPINKNTCNKCGSDASDEEMLVPTTTNHTQNGQHLVAYVVNKYNGPQVEIAPHRVEFLKKGGSRVKAGAAYRQSIGGKAHGHTHEGARWGVFFCEGVFEEPRPIWVFITAEAFRLTHTEIRGGDE